MGSPIYLDEIAYSITAMKNNRATGKDGFPSEVFKSLAPELIDHLDRPFNLIWENGKVPQDFKNAIIISRINVTDLNVETIEVSHCF